MNEIKFADGVLTVIKSQFPELYEQHIKGRVIELINESAPLEPDDGRGKRVCRVNWVLRLLWALGRLNQKMGTRSITHFNAAARPSIPSACRGLDGGFQYTIGFLCWLAFWEFVRMYLDRGSSDVDVFLNHDWSITTVTSGSANQEVDPEEQSPLDVLLHLISVQAENKDMTDWISAIGRRGGV